MVQSFGSRIVKLLTMWPRGIHEKIALMCLLMATQAHVLTSTVAPGAHRAGIRPSIRWGSVNPNRTFVRLLLQHPSLDLRKMDLLSSNQA